MHASVEFVPSGRGKARCPPNPDYPNGIALDACKPDELGCVVDLPYPASECGTWRIACTACQMTVACTAAGRSDDPISIKIPCQIKATA